LRGVAQDGGARTESESNSSTKEGSELYRFFVRGEELAGTINQKGAVDDAAITVMKTTEVPKTISTNTFKPKEKGEKDKKKKRKRSENVLDDDSSTEGPAAKKREEKHKKRKIKKSSSDPEQPPVESVPISIQADDDNVKRKEKEKKREKTKQKTKGNSEDVNDEKHNGRKGKKIRGKAMISTGGYLTPTSIEEAERPKGYPTQTVKIQNDRRPKDKDSKVSDTDMSKSRRKSKDRPEKSKKDKSRKKEKG